MSFFRTKPFIKKADNFESRKLPHNLETDGAVRGFKRILPKAVLYKKGSVSIYLRITINMNASAIASTTPIAIIIRIPFVVGFFT